MIVLEQRWVAWSQVKAFEAEGWYCVPTTGNVDKDIWMQREVKQP